MVWAFNHIFYLRSHQYSASKGCQIKCSSAKALEELWLWSHLPLHLSLIMMLEGMKNIFSTPTLPLTPWSATYVILRHGFPQSTRLSTEPTRY